MVVSLNGGRSAQPAGGGIRGDLQQKVNQLESMVQQQIQNPGEQRRILGALQNVKSGTDLSDALSSLSGKEKTDLANLIASVAEPPEELKEYCTVDKNWSEGQEDDCALRQVETAEKEGTKDAGGLMNMMA